jgi:hypothetical protein
MFNTLFYYPHVLARHCQGPSAQARERYLNHCADQGAARNTLLRTARELLVIAERLDLTTDQMISIRPVETAAEHWVHHQERRGRIRSPRGSRRFFIQTALRWQGIPEIHSQGVTPGVFATKAHCEYIVKISQPIPSHELAMPMFAVE